MEYPQIKSLEPKASKLVVFLHGVGSDGHDLIGLVPYIQQQLPQCHFISPHGVEAYDMAPFGRQWFSLQNRDNSVIKDLLKINSPKVGAIIKEKQQELGLSNKDTILFGFSQGTMTSLYMALTALEPFAGVVACSGKLIEPKEICCTTTAVCLIHGQEDDVLPAKEMIITAKFLQNHNIPFQQLLIKNLGHSIDSEALEFALKFINESFKMPI